MPFTIAFDVYGTLIDTSGVTQQLSSHIGDRATAFSNAWREKQLEYTFRRALMQRYAPFPLCTLNALDYVCAVFDVDLRDVDKTALMDCYRELPAFEDTMDGLEKLRDANYRLFAFSNGITDDIDTLLSAAGIIDYFDGIVSVDEIGSFKPDPAVYQHFLQRTNTRTDHAWLISGNPFDILGAMSTGFKTAWIRRSPDNHFDPWGKEATITLNSLTELHNTIATYNE